MQWKTNIFTQKYALQNDWRKDSLGGWEEYNYLSILCVFVCN